MELGRYTDIIRSEHLPALGRALSQIPDFSWLLQAPHGEVDRLQGDVLSDCPTVALDQTGQPYVRNLCVMVLNNTCDLPDDRVSTIAVAPIFDFNKFVDHTQTEWVAKSVTNINDKIVNFARAIRENKKTEWLYLPPFARFSHGAIVMFDRVCSIAVKLYTDSLTSKGRLASFSQTGFYYFLMKLTYHIARPETDDVQRE